MSSTVSDQACGKPLAGSGQDAESNGEVSLLDMLKARLDEKDAELATIPVVAQEILAASENPDCTLQDLEAIVNKDQVIATNPPRPFATIDGRPSVAASLSAFGSSAVVSAKNASESGASPRSSVVFPNSSGAPTTVSDSPDCRGSPSPVVATSTSPLCSSVQ